MREQPLYASFNGGEVSPLLYGRPDTQKYQASLSVCRNFIPRVQGALIRRGGTRFVKEIKDSSERAWLVPFEYSVDDAFVLEFGDLYIRFYRNRGVFEDTPGHAYEIVSPYALADLTNPDGTFALQYVQSGDVVYLAHAKYQPRKLTRDANDDWTLAILLPKGGPFKDQNDVKTTTVYASAGSVGSTVTLTASAAIWEAGHVGSLFQLEMADAQKIKPWAVYQPTVTGTVKISDSHYYECTDGENATGDYPTVTGPNKPIHTSGAYWDGDGVDLAHDDFHAIGVEWTYLHSGFGWVQITGFTNSTHVTAKVISVLPDEVVGSGHATWRWSQGAWSDVDGWPSCVTFFRERLTFAGGRRVYFSVSGDYENFQAKEFGIVTPDSAMNIQVQSRQGSDILWLAPVDRLIVGTGGSMFAVGEITTTQPFGPNNVVEKDQVAPGARGVIPIAPDAVVYVEKGGRILNELALDSNVNKYVALDLTVFAEHMTLTGVTQMFYAKQPHDVIWCVRADGGLRGFTYKKAQGVSAWHRQNIGPSLAGSAVVECGCSIPSPDGSRDDPWLIVRRTIDGVTRRYIEYVSPEYLDGGDVATALYSDCGLIYDDTPTSTLNGLDHLEGEAVNIKADGAYHAQKTVASGSVTLDREASKVTVGLPIHARGRLLPLESGGDGGTAQGRPKRTPRLVARVVNSLGSHWGADFDENLPAGQTMVALQTRTPEDPMDAVPPLVTRDIRIELPNGDYDGRSTIAFECREDFPFTLVALMPDVTTYGG